MGAIVFVKAGDEITLTNGTKILVRSVSKRRGVPQVSLVVTTPDGAVVERVLGEGGTVRVDRSGRSGENDG